jgi:uncharacterized membrane protein YdjX (TVP38/TMEM64 family)
MAALRNFFWALALAVIAAYLFFLVLGAFNAEDVLPVSMTVAVLVVLWAGHAWLQSRHRDEEARDPLLRRARERRGF